MGIADFLQPFASSLTYICVLVLATFAITLIYKTSATTNFAQGSIAALGCYLVAYLSMRWAPDIPYWVSIIIGLVAGLAIGLLIDIGIFRRGRSVNLIGKQIITMGMVTLIIGVIPLIFGATEAPQIPAFVEGYWVVEMGEGWSFTISKHTIVCLAITAVVLTVLFILLYKSKWGLGVRATASNEMTAGIIGINTTVITATSWAIAAGLAVLAGVMLNAGSTILTSTFMTQTQVNSFLSGILGGFSTFYGPIVGAAIVPLLTEIVGYFGLFEGADFLIAWKEVIVYGVLLVVILIKPNGLFGKKIIKKV
jgi:branched-chain amino acid transport system permease protein